MKNKNNNIYKINIFLNLFCLYQLKQFTEEQEDLSELNSQVVSLAKKYGFTNMFDEEEFTISRERIERMFSAVSKALFLRHQSHYYSRYTDALTILLANNFIPNNPEVINYITDDLKNEYQIHFLPNFRRLTKISHLSVKQETNKINLCLKEKRLDKTDSATKARLKAIAK